MTLPWQFSVDLCQVITRSTRFLLLSFFVQLLAIILGVLLIGRPSWVSNQPSPGSSLSFFQIFLTNSRAVISISLGGFLFSIPTITALALTGINTGIGFSLAVQRANLLVALAAFGPHGLFELPALWLAGAAGLKITFSIIQYLRGNSQDIITSRDIKDFVVLVSFSLLLIIFAGWIEINFTSEFVNDQNISFFAGR